MKNIKLEIFNFRKSLSIEQEEVSNILEAYLGSLNDISEKQTVLSLNERLKTYTYDKEVKSFLEALNSDMKEYQLVYELKHLYSVLNTKNQGELYRQPINVILQTINLDSDSDRMSKVLNELAIYDWVPEIKLFVHNLTKSPEQRANLLSGGKGEPIYTLVEQVENGYICLIRDSWFFLSDDNIEKTLVETHVKDESKILLLRTLSTAMQYSNITAERINFRISENLTIGLSVSKKGQIYINEDLLNKETTLESLFNSPIVPLINKNFYPLIVETANNLDKFVELDIVKKISNIVNPYLEAYVFNYKDASYIYRCDERFGHSLFKYESVIEIVNEIKNDLNYDLTYFFENKLDKELITKRKLEDKEKEIVLKLEDIKFNISKIKTSLQYIGESTTLETALVNLEKRETILSEELQSVKELQYNERVKN